MADLYYYEAGYIDIGYHVYIADAEIYISPYFEDGYIDAGYYLDYSAIGTLTCDAEIVTGVTVEASGTWTSAISLTAVIGRLQSAQADFTGAFSPTLTVDAFKNHTAIIESTTTFTVDAQANRSANVLLEHIANLNAQAAKTAVIDSTMATQATLSAQANHSVVSSATLTSTTTFTCLAFNVQFGVSTLNSTTSIFTSRYLGTGRPRTGTVDASAYYDATTKYEGTHSIARSGLGSIYTSDQYDQFRPKANQAFNFSTYVWVDEGPGPDNTSNAKILAGIGQLTNQNPNSRDATEDMWYVSMLARKLSVSWNIGGTWYTGSANSGNIDLNGTAGWVNINFYRSANDTVVYYSASGSPVVGGSATRSRSLAGQNGALTQPATASNRKLKLFGVDNSYFIGADPITRFDDLSYSVNDVNQIVLKFNNNSNDSLEVITHEGAAALSASGSVSAQANPNTKQITTSLTSTVNATVNADGFRSATATLSSAFTISATIGTIEDAISLVVSAVTVTADNVRVRYFESVVNSAFTPSITVVATKVGETTLSSSFTISVNANSFTDVPALLNSEFTFTAAVDGITRLADATLSSQSSLTNIPGKLEQAAASLSGAMSFAVTAIAFEGTSLMASMAATITVTATKTARITKTLSSVATMQTTARVALGDSNYPVPDNKRFLITLDSATPTDEYGHALTGTGGILTNGKWGNAHKQTPSSQAGGLIFDDTVGDWSPIVIQHGDFANLDTTDWTLEFWYRPYAWFNTVPYAGPANPTVIVSINDLIAVGYKVVTPTSSSGTTQDQKHSNIIFQINAMPFVNQTGTLLDAENTFVNWQNLYSSNVSNWGGYTTDFYYFRITHRYLGNNDHTFGLYTNLPPGSNSGLVDGNYENVNYNFGSNTNTKITIGPTVNSNRFYGQIDDINFYNFVSYDTATHTLPPAAPAAIAPLFYRAGDAFLEPRFNFTSDVLRVLFGLADFSSLAIQSTQAMRIRQGLCAVTTAFNQSITGNYQASAQSAQSVTVTQSVSAQRTRLATVSLASTVTQNAIVTRVREFESMQSVAAIVSTDAVKTTGNIVNAECMVSQSTDADRIRTNGADFVAFNSQLTAAFKNATGTVLLETQSQMQITAEKNAVGAVAVVAQFTQSTDTADAKTVRISADLSAQFTQSTQGDRIQPAGSEMLSAFTQSTDTANSKTTRVNADFSATVSLSAQGNRLRDGIALQASLGTLSCSIDRLRQASSAMSAVIYDFIASPTFIVRITANFTAFNTQLTVGNVINIDPYLTLTIPAESRALRILPENREITIESETRVNII